MLPFRPAAVDYEIDGTSEQWAYALELERGDEVDAPKSARGQAEAAEEDLPSSSLTFDPAPSAGWSLALPQNSSSGDDAVR